MSIPNRQPLHLSLLALALTLSISAYKTTSTLPSVAPTPPEVRCKQQAAPEVRRAPRDSEWIDWTPPKPGEGQGAARLSRKAALWIAEVLGVVEKQRGLRAVEHNCLDALEKRGLITQ